MDAYFDSAIIVKLYVKEATSPDAIRLTQSCPTPFLLTSWQALETENAIRLKAFRQEITALEMGQSIAAFTQDIASGLWRQIRLPAADIEQKSHKFSAAYAAILGCRTLDIIHVAAATLLGVRSFITFDSRQAALAKQAGLVVKP